MEEKPFSEDDTHEALKIIVTEVLTESAISNPTTSFNASLPHIDLKIHTWKTISYKEFKKQMMINDAEEAQKLEEEKAIESDKEY